MTTFRNGDRIRITFEGEVDEALPCGRAFLVLEGGSGRTFFGKDEIEHAKIEVLEPKFAIGDRVKSPMGKTAIVLGLHNQWAWLKTGEDLVFTSAVAKLERIP